MMAELSLQNLLWIFATACVVNNFTLSYFLGLCPFLGVSGRIDTALRMGMANIFVMTVTSVCAWALNSFVLPYAPYLRLISFIVVIASTVQFVEMAIKKLSPALFRALGIFLPLITTNCAILGLALFQTNRGYDFVEGLVFAVGAGARAHAGAGADGGHSRGERAGRHPRGPQGRGHELPHRRHPEHGLHGLRGPVQPGLVGGEGREPPDRGACLSVACIVGTSAAGVGQAAKPCGGGRGPLLG